MNQKLPVLAVIAAVITHVQGASIVYNLRDTGATSAIESGAYTVDGVTMQLSTEQGALNQTSSGFGVNHSSSGGSEKTDQIDGVHGIETITFWFSEAGILDQLNFSSVGGEDELSLTKNNQEWVSITQNTPDLDLRFLASDRFHLSYVSGNGVSFDGAQITSTPEPSTFILLGFGGLALLVHRKRPASSKASSSLQSKIINQKS